MIRNRSAVARFRWWLLPHVGYYAENFGEYRFWMRYTRWIWVATGWLPRSELFR